jgi:hypothetical protein
MIPDTSGDLANVPEPVPVVFDLLAAGLLLMAEKKEAARLTDQELAGERAAKQSPVSQETNRHP